jgi:hypothetical protein
MLNEHQVVLYDDGVEVFVGYFESSHAANEQLKKWESGELQLLRD